MFIYHSSLSSLELIKRGREVKSKCTQGGERERKRFCSEKYGNGAQNTSNYQRNEENSSAKLIMKNKIKREERERDVYIGHSLMLKGLWIVKVC
jgi:hypothetical protein